MFKEQESWDKTCRSLFAYLGKNPGTWLLSSNKLKEAADALRATYWPKETKQHDLDAAVANFRIGPVYMLLMGMAMEDALKAIIIAQEAECFGDDGISNDIAIHDLKDLWSKAGIHKCKQDDRLLDRLKSFVVTFGRYPVPRTKQNMDTMIGSSFHADPDFDKVARLWLRLEKHTKKTIPELFEEDSKQDKDKC